MRTSVDLSNITFMELRNTNKHNVNGSGDTQVAPLVAPSFTWIWCPSPSAAGAGWSPSGPRCAARPSGRGASTKRRAEAWRWRKMEATGRRNPVVGDFYRIFMVFGRFYEICCGNLMGIWWDFLYIKPLNGECWLMKPMNRFWLVVWTMTFVVPFSWE